MPDHQPKVITAINDRDHVATELAQVTARWNKARANGAHPTEIRALSTKIAALNERLKQIDDAR